MLLLGTIVFSFLPLHTMTLCSSVNISEKIRESMEEIFKKKMLWSEHILRKITFQIKKIDKTTLGCSHDKSVNVLKRLGQSVDVNATEQLQILDSCLRFKAYKRC